MKILLYIILITYVVAVNGYGILILFFQKRELEESREEEKSISDGRLLIVGALGGATGILTFMFILKYRLKNLPLMLLLPVLVAINVFLIILAFKFGTNYFNR